MTKYFIDVNHTKQKRFLHHSKKLIVLVVILLLLAATAIIVDSYINKRLADVPSSSSKPSVSTVTSSIQIFTTNYFQFQADKEWRSITNESTPSKFTYRRLNSKIVSADLTIYINSAPESSESTRILPVELNESSKTLKAQELSKHCRENVPAGERSRIGNKEITLGSIRFNCDVDGTLFTAMAGKIGGTTTMNFSRTDGSSANYIIYYRDLRAIPLESEFASIINTLQIR